MLSFPVITQSQIRRKLIQHRIYMKIRKLILVFGNNNAKKLLIKWVKQIFVI